jgi:hypothetical protein
LQCKKLNFVSNEILNRINLDSLLYKTNSIGTLSVDEDPTDHPLPLTDWRVTSRNSAPLGSNQQWPQSLDNDTHIWPIVRMVQQTALCDLSHLFTKVRQESGQQLLICEK